MAKCFVIGPIGEAGTNIRADADDFMKYIVAPVVSDNEFDYEAPIRADSLNEPGRITSQIVSLLMEAELVIADLTTNNANVFYELSLRHAIGKPVIHMAAAGTPLSFDVRDNRTIFYTMHSREAEAARDELAKQIRHVRKPGYKAMNPILETVGIVNLENSNIPEKAAIGQLMSMIEGLSYNILDVQRQLRFDPSRTNALAAFAVTNPIVAPGSGGTTFANLTGSRVGGPSGGRAGGGPGDIVSANAGLLSGLTTTTDRNNDIAKASTFSVQPKSKK